MALTYPLNVNQFFDDLNIRSGKFTLSESNQNNINGGGHILTASLGSRLWMGEATLVPAKHQELLVFEARIELLLEPGASFIAYDKRVTYPKSDPTGSILGASTPTLSVVNANNVDVTIAGLPAGYVLTQGDMFDFTYLSSPTRRALHRIVAGATATGGGLATVQVVPAIRAGFTIGAAVGFVKPNMKAKIIPGSYGYSEGGVGRLSSGASFQFMQTLK